MTTTSSPILKAENLVVGYGKKGSVAVLPPLNLELYPGQLIGLLGSNGAGKSTLLRTIAGAQRSLGGSVTVGGKDVATCSPKELARLIAIVYTDRVHAGGLTVRQVIALGRHPHISALGRLGDEDLKAVEEALETVGITELADRYLSRLSDGERQKVMIARTLAQHTPVIILDEPTTFLDVASRLEMFRLLRDLADNHNKAIIVSTHEVAPVLNAAHALWLITSDRQMVAGSVENLIADGSMNRLFAPSKRVSFSPALRDFILD